jgi:hypothetical protein
MMFLKKYYPYYLIIALCGVSSIAFASQCSDSETIKTLKMLGNYRSALQTMGACLKDASNPLSLEDSYFFQHLMKQILSVDNTTSLVEASENFQSVLLNHPVLKELAPRFQFKDNFQEPKEQSAEQDKLLFSKVRQAQEQYYFYYDTGRLFSNARGIALTDQSLIWKNLTGKPHRVSFADIKKMELIYDQGFSLKPDLSATGWKLKIDEDSNHDIRLSHVPGKAIEPLVEAMVYFINFNKAMQNQKLVKLIISNREKGIIAGWITQCSRQHINQGNPLRELPLLDRCLSDFDKDFKFSKNDSELLNKLTTQIFENQEVPFKEGYNHFRVVLSTHFFAHLGFKFEGYNFDTETKDDLFKEVRQSTDSYYFYLDMGTMASAARGLALTDKAILWKNFIGHSVNWGNITGLAHRLPFEEIKSVTLIHDTGLTSTWKLRLNEDEKNDIILSDMSERGVQLFASGLVYFINVASDANLTLQTAKNE